MLFKITFETSREVRYTLSQLYRKYFDAICSWIAPVSKLEMF